MPWFKKCDVQKDELEEKRTRMDRLAKEAQSKLGATLDELEQLLRKTPDDLPARPTEK